MGKIMPSGFLSLICSKSDLLSPRPLTPCATTLEHHYLLSGAMMKARSGVWVASQPSWEAAPTSAERASAPRQCQSLVDLF